MFSSFLLFVAVLASVHSFIFVAATPEPLITPAPFFAKREEAVASKSQSSIPRTSTASTPILSTIIYSYTDLPEEVYPYQVLRGPQFGYNRCNSTTQGSDSLCQTLIFNNLSDFCLWGSPSPNGSIGDEEAKVVAYCTQNNHGARPIPFGSITGAQFMKTSAYIQIVGFIDNTGIGLAENDTGGELDPHGADLQGNPLGGVVYSSNIPDAKNGSLTQVHNWNMFVGSGLFCVKICFNNVTEPDFCQNRYDLVGCEYNMPSQVQNGTFTSCEGDLQDVVGVYSVNGVTSTWSMPETLSTRPPYTARVPASSSCQTFHSTDLFPVPSTTSGTAKATASGTGQSSSGGSSTSTGRGAAAPSSTSSALSTIGVPPAFYALGLGMMAGVALVL